MDSNTRRYLRMSEPERAAFAEEFPLLFAEAKAAAEAAESEQPNAPPIVYAEWFSRLSAAEKHELSRAAPDDYLRARGAALYWNLL